MIWNVYGWGRGGEDDLNSDETVCRSGKMDGIKGWIRELENGWRDSGQAPFIIAGLNMTVWVQIGMCVYLCVCVGVSVFVFMMVLRCVCLCRHASMHDCIRLCLCVLGGWAQLLWSLPAANGLARWHHWNGADIFECVFVLFCGCISDESKETYVLWV